MTGRVAGKAALFRALAASVALAPLPGPLAQRTAPGAPMKITVRIGLQTLTATLTDSPATREFLAQLPLTLTVEDYASAEKIAVLPRRLSTGGTPTGRAGRAGAITYYAPWGNLALFYKDFTYSTVLIHLGQFDGPVDALRAPGRLRINIARAT